MLYLTLVFPFFLTFSFLPWPNQGENPPYFVKKKKKSSLVDNTPLLCTFIWQGTLSDLNDNDQKIAHFDQWRDKMWLSLHKKPHFTPSQEATLNSHVQSPLLLSLTFEMKSTFFPCRLTAGCIHSVQKIKHGNMASSNKWRLLVFVLMHMPTKVHSGNIWEMLLEYPLGA